MSCFHAKDNYFRALCLQLTWNWCQIDSNIPFHCLSRLHHIQWSLFHQCSASCLHSISISLCIACKVCNLPTPLHFTFYWWTIPPDLVIVFHISSHRKHTSANKPPQYTPIHTPPPSLPPPSLSQTLETVAIKQISLKSVPGRLSNIRQKEIAILKVTTTHVTFKMAAKCTTLPLISQVWLSKLCPTMIFISHYSTTQEVKHSNVVQLYDYHVSYTLVMWPVMSYHMMTVSLPHRKNSLTSTWWWRWI